MLSLWLNKDMFWASEHRLVDQANTIRKNSLMIELEIEELGRNLAENDSCKKEERRAGDTDSNLGEEVRDILTALEEDKEVTPLVVGSLGAIPKQFGIRLKETGITAEIRQVLKIVLLGTARILRKVLEI